MAKAKIGIKGKAYRNTGTYGSPTWSEITILGDVQINSDWNTANATTRASRIEVEVPTTLNLGWTAKVRNDDDDTNFIALLAAYHGPTAVDFLVLDGANDVVSSQGYRGYFYIKKFGVDQGLQSAQFFDAEFIPDSAIQVPKTAAVGAGPALAYSAIAP